ncbi:hypothetical protein ACTXT7_016718 [Hymenolepis weldensis]
MLTTADGKLFWERLGDLVHGIGKELNWPPRARESRSILNALLTHSLTQNTRISEKSAWHGMMDENPGESMHDILPKIFKCLKEQQYTRNVLQDLCYKSYVRRHFMWTKITQENCAMRAKGLSKN